MFDDLPNIPAYMMPPEAPQNLVRRIDWAREQLVTNPIAYYFYHLGKVQTQINHDHFLAWAKRHQRKGHTITALIPPQEAEGIRYAGFYCEDYKPIDPLVR